MRDLFTAMDRNGDMVLSKEEFTSGLQLLKLPGPTQQDLEALCNVVDVNGDGSISFAELRRLINMNTTRQAHIGKREALRTEADLLAGMGSSTSRVPDGQKERLV